MLNLEKFAGLPIEMREDFSLRFGEGMRATTPDVREYAAMKNYLKDPQATYPRREIYYMYRDLALDEHWEAITAVGLEYDITVIPPGKFNDEYVKTIGHYHPYKPATQVRYPEVYEVIYGQVFWLLQSATDDFDTLKEIYLVEAGRGEKVIVPPGFGHISINPADEVLILANWQPLGNKGIYEPYEAHQGGAYYVVESKLFGEKGVTRTDYEFVPNLNYKALPPLKHARPRELPQYDLRSALPVYFTATKNLETLDFLVNPENYVEELTPEKLLSEK